MSDERDRDWYLQQIMYVHDGDPHALLGWQFDALLEINELNPTNMVAVNYSWDFEGDTLEGEYTDIIFLNDDNEEYVLRFKEVKSVLVTGDVFTFAEWGYESPAKVCARFPDFNPDITKPDEVTAYADAPDDFVLKKYVANRDALREKYSREVPKVPHVEDEGVRFWATSRLNSEIGQFNGLVEDWPRIEGLLEKRLERLTQNPEFVVIQDVTLMGPAGESVDVGHYRLTGKDPEDADVAADRNITEVASNVVPEQYFEEE